MPKSCEVVELRNSADVVGYPCPGAASKECSDCGIRLCEDHAETCGTCRSIFCRPVVSYIERSTRSLRTGNVENERELRACNKTSPTSIEERLQRSHKLGLNRAIQFDGRPPPALRKTWSSSARRTICKRWRSTR